ncbi:MAG: hypothetical protein ACFFAY_05545 [Promethearchaeota archaeon]
MKHYENLKSDACIIFAKRIGSCYFLLKNRDLIYADFNNQGMFDETTSTAKRVHIEACMDSVQPNAMQQ